MATDIFTRAKAYRKNHPNTAWTDCVKACAKKAPAKKAAAPKKRRAAVGKGKKKAAGKASVPVRTRKVKLKIKRTEGSPTITIGRTPDNIKRKQLISYAKANNFVITKGYDTAKGTPRTLSGINMDRVRSEQAHQASLTSSIKKHLELLKQKGLKLAEKAGIRREIARYRAAMAASKKHVIQLKKSI